MIKTLLKSVRDFKKPSILTSVFMVLEVFMEILIPLLLSMLIDNGIAKGDINQMIIIGICLVVSATLSLVFGVISGKCAAKASSGFARNLREDIYNKIQDFSFFNIDKFSTSSLITRLTTDITNLQQAYMMTIKAAVRAPVTIIFAITMSFIIDARIGLIYLISAPILGFLLIFIAKYVNPIFEKVFYQIDQLNCVVQENVRAIRVVKSFVTEEKEIEKFNKASEEIYRNFSRAEKILAFNSPIMQFMIYGCLTLISFFGAKFIVAGTLTTGELASLFSYIMQMLNSLMLLAMVFVMITIAWESGQRAVEVLREESDLKNKENPIYDVKNGKIEFVNVGFSYVKDKNKEVLKEINLTINSGETVGIIGSTGDGKSTLVSLIPRLYDVTTGEVKVGDINVKDYDIKTLRDQVSMVLQKNELFSGTIKDNIRWGNLQATDKEIVEVCKLAQADEFISTFPDGYNTKIEQGGSNVSGGQKQRLCIARALLKKPKILILDDSTSAVDTKTDKLIRTAFNEKIPNTTKIIIAQRISSVQDADKIIVMSNGRIQAVGNHEELLKTNAVYKEIYDSQMKGSGEDEK